jgi:glycosyltransferase involved in cell wall biosynthesis
LTVWKYRLACFVPIAATVPGVTFAIPFYKGVEYLERAIGSVFAQQSPHWVLLVCDDSPDGAGEQVLKKRTDPRIRYIRNTRTLGMAENWNCCLKIAETELVTLLHADDELLPGYSGLMIQAASEYPASAAFFCRARVIGPDGFGIFSFADKVKDFLMPWGQEPVRVAGPAGIAGLLRGNYIMCPTVCYRKPIIGLRRFEERWKFALDLEFFTRLLRDGLEMIGIPAFGYAYRRHSGNATAVYTESLLRFEEEAALYDELASDAKSRGWGAVERIGHRKRIIRLHLGYRIVSDVVRGRLKSAANKFDFLCRLNRRRCEIGRSNGN